MSAECTTACSGKKKPVRKTVTRKRLRSKKMSPVQQRNRSPLRNKSPSRTTTNVRSILKRHPLKLKRNIRWNL